MDLLIRGAMVFDGVSRVRFEDVGVKDGRIVRRPKGEATRVIDGSGLWLTPGFLDIHTHYDLEVELEPGLPESVRHGTTTVVMSNCSLGLAFGNQRHTGHDPVVSCFARVENLPKRVLRKAGDLATWRTPREYLDHLGELPLGCNVVPMLPHSMLRIEVMGLPDAIQREPDADELSAMAGIVEDAMEAGYPGFSTDSLPFHYLANDPWRQAKIPTQHATFGELKALTGVVRDHDRVWQMTPPKDHPLKVLRALLLSSRLLHGKTLKTTAVAALDVIPNRQLLRMARFITSLLNNRLMGGDLRMQALAAPFKIWSDGPITPIAEEVGALRALNEPDIEDRDARMALLNDPAWVARFKAWWHAPEQRWGAWLKRALAFEDTQFQRSLDTLIMDRGPVADWFDETFEQVYGRLMVWQQTGKGARSDAERDAFSAAPKPIGDDADFFIWVLAHFDTDQSWWTVIANDSPARIKRILDDDRFFPGFSDAGAHIANMAFYDNNLRALQLAAEDGDAGVSRMVRLLTRAPAEFFGIDAGRLDDGAPADLVLIDPVALQAYDSEAHVTRHYRECFEHEQLVNRSDGVVKTVVVGGKVVWDGEDFTEAHGTEKLGRVLTA